MFRNTFVGITGCNFCLFEFLTCGQSVSSCQHEGSNSSAEISKNQQANGRKTIEKEKKKSTGVK